MRQDTKLVHFGRGAAEHEGTVNVPVHRASTILSPDVESYIHRFDGDNRFTNITYGASGTHNARALREAIAALEDAEGCIVTSSGLSCITMTLSALLGAGDHALITDSAYGPTRNFCLNVLTRYGVEITFYDPAAGAGVESLIRKNTRLVFTEAPGSLTFEMQDIPAIAAVAKKHGLISVTDNTWATPLFFKPLEHGIDVSLQAATKYIAGHSDLVIGAISTRDDALYRRIADHTKTFGDVAGPDDCYLALRGLRTLGIRLERQQRSALRVAEWLSSRAEVKRVLFPALPDDPGHAIWQRDFSGASSLFGIALQADDEVAKRWVDALRLFGIGSSWGGFESLVAFNYMAGLRETTPWTDTPYLLRMHIGLEDPQDLIDDLESAFNQV